MSEIEKWLAAVLGAVRTHEFADFSGLGLVFYLDRSSLPVHPLVPSDGTLNLPAKTLQECATTIAEISRRGSIYHDGFHLVDARTLWITDVSQFVSPPIPPEPLVISGVGGARHMTARLVSLLPSVSLAAVWTGSEGVRLYENGIARVIQMPM